jgi:hypothetical protein
MKTLLAIALAAAALTIGTATVAPISSTAIAGGDKPVKWCGAAACAHRFGPQPSGTQSSGTQSSGTQSSGATDQHRGR